ncbi:MAG: hypothetical protein HZB55_05735 [Deltaproteobacteria bacterium]|nr:hypothetical protein [Deltaproteobacteria bacterium]
MTREPSTPEGPPEGPLGASSTAAPPPKRYRALEDGGGPAIAIVDAPNVVLRLVPGVAVDVTGLKRFGRQTIFLDGAYTGGPFYDNETRQYSLDHHADCVRAFTLATCEQAAVVLVQGIPIAEGRWTLVVNDPDLDALLAAWVLMNHEDLRRDGWRLLKVAMPLLRLEGVVDAHGFGREMLAALPDELLEVQSGHLESLMQPLRVLKASGSGETAELVDLVLTELEAIDEILLPPAVRNRGLGAKEVARVRLRGGRIAVLCASRVGIFEVEEQLRVRYGEQLGLVLLD